ncbi:MAG: DUF4097 family beta strand repeat-containing protein [bacterium]
MKPHAFPDRNLTVMRQLLLTAALILALASSELFAERIEKVSGSRYETETITTVKLAQEYDNLSFTSSSYIGGTLRIRAGGTDESVITYRKILKASSTEQAETFADYINVRVEELENELAIAAETPSRPPWSGTDFSGRLELEVTVPANEGLKVYVRTTAHEIEIVGPFASVDISNEFGDVVVSDISSKVKVSTENSAVKVTHCSGPVTVRTSARPILLSEIDSKLGTVTLRNTNGMIVMENVTGELDVRTDLAPIRATGIQLESGRSKIRTESSTLQLEVTRLNGDLTLINSHGKVELSLPPQIDANFNLRVDEGGRIYTSGIPIKTELVTRTMLNGVSGRGQHQIDVDMRGVGTISLRELSTDEL